MSDLTPKQRLFVQEYLIDLNATQAAIRAGYSEKTSRQMGDENLSKPDIALAIELAMKERSDRTEITADRVLKELAKLGFSDIRKAIIWRANVTGMAEDDDGTERLAVTNQVQLVDSDQIDDDTAASIAQIGQLSNGGLTLKFHDKRAALESIGRHLGMFKDKTEISGPGGGPVQLQRIELVPVEPVVNSKA